MPEMFLMSRFFSEENRKKTMVAVLTPVIFASTVLLAASDMGSTAGTAASPLSEQVE